MSESAVENRAGPHSRVGDLRNAKETGLFPGVRARVIVLIVGLQALMLVWVADSELEIGVHLLCYSLMMPTVLYLVLARVCRRWLPFDQNELLLAYVVLTATIPIVGYGGMRFIAAGMGYLPFFSTAQPQWLKFIPALSGLPVLHDSEAIRGLYRGGSAVPWRAWAVPIGFWSAYLISLSGIWLCLAGVMRRVWIHQERLTFPIAMLPLQMSDPREDLFHRPTFWIGFAIPAVLQSLLVFREWWPSVPALQLKAYFVNFAAAQPPPWNALPPFPFGLYPMAIGLAYFVPGDVSFSCWFLAVVIRFVVPVIGAAAGIEQGGLGSAASRFPYREEQAAGAWIAFAGIVIWGARHHWRSVAKMIPQAERASVRLCTIGAVACASVCAAMMVMAGVPKLAAGIIICVYIAYVLSGSRVRAEAGGQWTFAPLQFTPNRVAYSITGTMGWGDQALVSSGLFSLIHVDVRAQSMPYLMEGLDIAERSGIRWRTVLFWVGVGTLTALAIGWFTTLTKWYEIGAATAKAESYPVRKVSVAFDEVNRLAVSGGSWDRAGVAAMVFAAALTMALTRIRSLGFFGLHPAGYVLCNTLTMGAFIVPFFIAWLAKTCLLRFGGNRAYRGGVPFFVGVILGDILTQAVWTLIGWIFNVPIYQFLT